MPFAAHKVVIESVSDAGGLAKLIDDGELTADGVIAIIGKTEGNGGVNDYTRILADQAFRGVLKEKGSRSMAEIEEIPMAWSGGTDGIICPNAVILSRNDGPAGPDDQARLTVGISMSDQILPEDIGRPAMVTKIAAAVKVAMPKVYHDVVLRAMHLHGALGVSNEMPFSRMLIGAEVMAIADGPTEVHKSTVARQVLRDYKPVDDLWPSKHLPKLRDAAREKYAQYFENELANL